MAVIPIRRTTRLDGPIPPEALPGVLYQTEDAAHQFVISCTQGGEPVALSGTVSGKFIRSEDNATVPLTGTISDGAAHVTLNSSCYLYTGRFALSIFVSKDGAVTCVYSCTGHVRRTDGSETVDPSGEITLDVETLISDIEDAVASIPADYSDLLATVAGTYSSESTYAVGDYAWYDRTLYRCISPITTAESWTAGHWVQVVVGDDLDELKGAFDNSLAPVTWTAELTNGRTIDASTGINTSNSYWARTGMINGFGYRSAFALSNPDYKFRAHFYNANGSINNGTGYLGYSGPSKKGIIYIPKDAVRVCLAFNRADGAQMTSAYCEEIVAALKAYSTTDRTLALQGYAADALAAGNAISAVDNKATDTADSFYDLLTHVTKGRFNENWYKGSISDHGSITDEECPTVYSGRMPVRAGDFAKVSCDSSVEYRVIYYSSFTTQYNTWVKNTDWTSGVTNLEVGYTARIQARYAATPTTDITDESAFFDLVSISAYNTGDISLLSASNVFNAEPYSGEYEWLDKVMAYGALFKGRDDVEAFAFFTDPHVLGMGDDAEYVSKRQEYLKRVQNVINNVPISFSACGGDWLNNSTTMDRACYRLGLLKGVADNLLGGCKLVLGNHDTNEQGKLDSESANYTGKLTNATIAAIMYRDTDTQKAYYSFDGAKEKCYVLDSGYIHNTMLDYDWEQVAWLAGKLAEDDPARAIIFLHVIINSGNVQKNATNFGALVEAYNAHTTVTLNSVTYDFTGCTGHVDFWVAGHTHSDDTGTLGGIPYFTTASNGYTSDVPLIDLALVDYDEREIKLVRVGGTGEDRTIVLDPEEDDT